MIDCWRRTQSPASAATASRTTAAAQATDSAHAGARSARDQHAASNADGCAVSATGHGEYFIRSVVAYDVCALVAYRGWSLVRAARDVVQRKLRERGGEGGLVAIDRAGNVSMEFNGDGMFRAMRDSRGRRDIAILREREDYDRRD